MTRDASQETGQLSLLHGFGHSPQGGKQRKLVGTTVAAAEFPVAVVALDSPVPHLDRGFDYLVPTEMSDDAVPGARVQVRFGGRVLTGYILARSAESATSTQLRPLTKVLSPQPVALPVLPLARRIADRYAGTLSDVLRTAIPPRVARVDKEFVAGAKEDGVTAKDSHSSKGHGSDMPRPATSPFDRYDFGPRFLAHLGAGDSPRAVMTSLGGFGQHSWADELSAAIAATLDSGRGAVAVVPHARDLAILEGALAKRIGAPHFVRLSAEDGPTPRYRNFLLLLHGHVQVAIGTRSAAYAPVSNLGLVCLWDDGDDLHREPRAPYQHVREVLLLRAEHENAAMLLSAFSRSTDSQRLIEAGWAQSIQAPRSAVRASVPRVVHTGDSYQQAVDPMAQRARIPHTAWAAAKAGLERGPILVQVARSGFAPALACELCREPARCQHCTGPLALGQRGGEPFCRWCGERERSFVCRHCGGSALRTTVTGAERTAEDLGRAFPSYPVLSSAGDHVLTEVADHPALVIATPGAEPVAVGGYAAALLLDGDAMLNHEFLRVAEDARRRWFNAAVLVRPASDGGTVTVTARESMSVAALVRWDPAGAAVRELTERRETFLPPAVRVAALTGSSEALTVFLDGLQLPKGVRTAGPVNVEVPRGPSTSRLLLFFSYRDAEAVTRQLTQRRAAQSARRTGDPVHLRCDAVDAL